MRLGEMPAESNVPSREQPNFELTFRDSRASHPATHPKSYPDLNYLSISIY